ncbi:MAG: hypothetical protein UT33_C0010G0031 [Candidatus Peregrinibacteria bacterium GW2011_GWC2_39_14]|nr:MAG: hypothetical protein US92_C0006G0031 [Candidatus Peregrinibacteria bacterium GW2011_GWA2_38_36]KKR05888.1 MAG: hypothetical protein UT33_C0010G0031 [Candidatus Peregrinibacteria bacterium GW2011_GWC2_39_14]
MKKIAILLLAMVIFVGVSGCMKRYSRASYIKASSQVACLAIDNPSLFATQEGGIATIKNAFKENGFPADDNEKMVEIVTKFKSDVEATNEIIEIVKSCEEESTKTM